MRRKCSCFTFTRRGLQINFWERIEMFSENFSLMQGQPLDLGLQNQFCKSQTNQIWLPDSFSSLRHIYWLFYLQWTVRLNGKMKNKLWSHSNSLHIHPLSFNLLNVASKFASAYWKLNLLALWNIYCVTKHNLLNLFPYLKVQRSDPVWLTLHIIAGSRCHYR